MSTYIETFTGRRFYPLEPCVEDICIEDIAHALARQCRFAGHVREFYSVGEHSFWVATILEFAGHDAKTQLWGLMHDASEAYLVDLPTPLKHGEFGAAYRKAEDNLMKAIAERFDLGECPAEIHEADRAALSREARQYMTFNEDNWKGLPDLLPFTLPRLGDIDFVEHAFLSHFKHLQAKL